ESATALRNSGRPRFDGYRCVSARCAAPARAPTTSPGEGVSGSPIPRLITSIPCACFSWIFRSSSANRYGGRRSSRSLVFTEVLQEFIAQRPRVHRNRPAGQVHVHVLADFDLELAAVQRDGHR